MRRPLYITLIIFIVIIVIYMFSHLLKPVHHSLEEKKINHPEKPIIFILIDSLMEEPLQKVIDEGKAPALRFFQENGYLQQVISSYPTMSVSIDSTILTGEYPDKHQIPGLVWFDVENKEMINYGSAKGETWKTGLRNVLENTFYHLNHTHLNKNIKTIHETLAEKGWQSASINSLIYRGPIETKLNLPYILRKMNFQSFNGKVQTPALFSYGRFSQYHSKNNVNTFPWRRFGFNDAFTALELIKWIEANQLPHFTFAYFAELDQPVHKKGVEQSLSAIEKVDNQLQNILNTFPSWEAALEKVIWMIMGDSGQSNVRNEKKEALIPLNDLFDAYQLFDVKKGVRKKDDLAIAYNERMAYIYPLHDQISTEQVIETLSKEKRIAFMAWKNKDSFISVTTPSKREQLKFAPGGPLKDLYKQTWKIKGDASILDLKITENHLSYGNYPDGLSRLYSALHSHRGDYIIVDAKPGFEFVGEGTPTHVGGASHGSLHKKDAMVPMIVLGTDIKPKHFRAVDLYDWFLQILDKNNPT